MSKKLSSLSIFFPAYNDEKTIASLTRACREIASELTDDYEILIVHDASQDNTGKVADQLAKAHTEVRVIHHPHNQGVGQTMVDGFTQSTKNYVFYTDGDFQYDVKELSLLAQHASEFDVIIGYRIKRAEGIKRVFTSRCFHVLIFLFFGIWYRDIDASFKLVHRRFLNKFEFKTKSALVDPELLINARRFKTPVKEIGVHHYPRQFGSSQCLRIKLIVSMIIDMIRLKVIYLGKKKNLSFAANVGLKKSVSE
jgi:glycosyltransferase involved in cell wall biosynthesis